MPRPACAAADGPPKGHGSRNCCSQGSEAGATMKAVCTEDSSERICGCGGEGSGGGSGWVSVILSRGGCGGGAVAGGFACVAAVAALCLRSRV